MSIVREDRLKSFAAYMTAAYKERTGIDCEIFTADAEDGAGRIN